MDLDGPAAIDSTALSLAELLATRLCHDIAGLCGTLGGALELAADDPTMADEALPLARDAAAELTSRLMLLRGAWGRAGEALDPARLIALATGLPGAHRLRLDVSGFPPSWTLSPERSRLLLNALLLGAEALPVGGTLRVAVETTCARMQVAGRRAHWPDGLADGLAQPRQAVASDNPRALQALLLAEMARDCGARLSLAPAPPAAPTGTELEIAPLRIDWGGA